MYSNPSTSTNRLDRDEHERLIALLRMAEGEGPIADGGPARGLNLARRVNARIDVAKWNQAGGAKKDKARPSETNQDDQRDNQMEELVVNPTAVFPILQLPNEVLGKVVNYLERCDALALRRVGNYHLKTIVEDLFENWSIRFHENSEHLDVLLTFRVREVKLRAFQNPLNFGIQGVIFKYPDHLKKFHMDISRGENDGEYFVERRRTDRNYNDARISSENLELILNCPNLEEISLFLNEVTLNGPGRAPLTGYNWASLDKLSIYVLSSSTDTDFYEDNVLIRILRHSRMPKLTSLEVVLDALFAQSTLLEISCSIINFVFHRGSNLRRLKYVVKENQGAEYQRDGRLASEYISKAMVPALEDVVLHGDTAPFTKSLWTTLITNRTSLTSLKITSESFISSEFCVQMTRRQFATLTSLHLANVVGHVVQIGGNNVNQFDLAVFRNCIGLKELILKSRKLPGAPYSELELRMRIRAIHLSDLPDQIESLTLEGFFLFTSKLSRFFDKGPALGLQKIRLEDCGPKWAFGLNWELIKQLLDMGQLKEIDIGRRCINSHCGPEKDTQLLQIFQNMGYPQNQNIFYHEIHRGFRIVRIPNTMFWKPKFRLPELYGDY